MTDAPERIWLQDDGDYEGARNSMAGTDTGVTWCDTPINDDDTEYIRADLVPRWSSDMDAAPKDWTRVLLFVPGYGAMTGHFDERWHLHSCINKEAQPTHWMPLPAPPKEGE